MEVHGCPQPSAAGQTVSKCCLQYLSDLEQYVLHQPQAAGAAGATVRGWLEAAWHKQVAASMSQLDAAGPAAVAAAVSAAKAAAPSPGNPQHHVLLILTNLVNGVAALLAKCDEHRVDQQKLLLQVIAQLQQVCVRPHHN
jgi:hypothetical protein